MSLTKHGKRCIYVNNTRGVKPDCIIQLINEQIPE